LARGVCDFARWRPSEGLPGGWVGQQRVTGLARKSGLRVVFASFPDCGDRDLDSARTLQTCVNQLMNETRGFLADVTHHSQLLARRYDVEHFSDDCLLRRGSAVCFSAGGERGKLDLVGRNL